MSKLLPVLFFAALALTTTTARANEGETTSPARQGFLGGLELLPQLSILSPSRLILSNGQYVVPYSDNVAGMPALEIGAALPLGQIGPFEICGVARTGFGISEAPVTVLPVSGGSRTVNMALDWIPLSGAVRMLYEIPGVSFVKPMLEVGGGVQWLHQSGDLPGLTGSFWIPFVFVTPGLTFLAGNRASDWFGGFTFGTSIQESVGTNQTLSGWSFDLGLNIFL